MAHARNIPRYEKENVGKKNWESDESWSPRPQENTSLGSFSSAGSNSSPACILLASFHSSAAQSKLFLYPPLSFFGSLEEPSPCLSESQDSATICSPWRSSETLG